MGGEGGAACVGTEDEEGRAPGVGFCGCRGEDGRLQDAASGRTGGSGVEEVSDEGAVGKSSFCYWFLILRVEITKPLNLRVALWSVLMTLQYVL